MYKAIFAEYNGKCPFIDFLNFLSKEERADILATIDKFIELKNNKNKISQKMSKNLRDGIFELRVMHQNKISRSLYFYYYDKTIIFTNGFIKKQNKTPNSEIEKAINIRNLLKKL